MSATKRPSRPTPDPSGGRPAGAPNGASGDGCGPGLLLVLSGPSGVGKTSIVQTIRRELDATFSVSATTRPPAEGEVDGREYWFMDEDEFLRQRDAGEFLEHAHVFGRYWYGTPRTPIEEALARGELVILDIDVQGALQIRESCPDALMVFVLPPSDEELERRLRTRGRDPEPIIRRRFEEAKREIDLACASGAYDHKIINDVLDRASAETMSIVRERLAANARRGGSV